MSNATPTSHTERFANLPEPLQTQLLRIADTTRAMTPTERYLGRTFSGSVAMGWAANGEDDLLATAEVLTAFARIAAITEEHFADCQEGAFDGNS